MIITEAEKKKFQAWLDEPVDWYMDGTPITRRSTMHSEIQSQVEFGWHAKASKLIEENAPKVSISESLNFSFEANKARKEKL